MKPNTYCNSLRTGLHITLSSLFQPPCMTSHCFFSLYFWKIYETYTCTTVVFITCNSLASNWTFHVQYFSGTLSVVNPNHCYGRELVLWWNCNNLIRHLYALISAPLQCGWHPWSHLCSVTNKPISTTCPLLHLQEEFVTYYVNSVRTSGI